MVKRRAAICVFAWLIVVIIFDSLCLLSNKKSFAFFQNPSDLKCLLTIPLGNFVNSNSSSFNHLFFYLSPPSFPSLLPLMVLSHKEIHTHVTAFLGSFILDMFCEILSSVVMHGWRSKMGKLSPRSASYSSEHLVFVCVGNWKGISHFHLCLLWNVFFSALFS